jgi:hypothetical protein
MSTNDDSASRRARHLLPSRAGTRVASRDQDAKKPDEKQSAGEPQRAAYAGFSRHAYVPPPRKPPEPPVRDGAEPSLATHLRS